jgi:RHS repeat-associated protein
MQKHLYALLFGFTALTAFSQANWQTKFMDKPSFQGEPLPPEYLGMSINEILATGYQHVSLPTMDPTDYQWADTDTDGLGNVPSDVSPELRGHPLLDQLVTDLGGDPLALAAYVQNEIELTDALQWIESRPDGVYTPTANQIMRGAMGTYMEKQGSPWEQCSLLVYLLRRAGYPAAYVETSSSGNYRGMWMLLRRMNNMFGYFLVEGVDESSVLRFDLPWVVVYTDKSGTGGEWKHLFPWIKDTVVEEGLDPYDYFPEGFNSGKKWTEKYLTNDPSINNLIGNDGRDTPGLLFKRYLREQAADEGWSVDDFGLKIYNRKNHYWSWDDFPKPYIIGQRNSTAWTEPLTVKTNDLKNSSDASKFATLQVKIQTVGGASTLISTPVYRLCDLHNRRFFAYYKPGENKIALELSAFDEDAGLSDGNFSSVNGFARQYKEVTNPGGSLEFSVDVSGLNPRFSTSGVDFTRPFSANSLAAICFNAGRATQEMLDVHARKFWEMEAASSTPAIQDYVSVMMYMTGLTYWKNSNSEEDELLRLHKAFTMQRYGVCIATMGPAPDSGNTIWTTPAVDIPVRQGFYGNRSHHPSSSVTRDAYAQDIRFLETVSGSSHEHQALNTFFDQGNSISTVKLLRLANERHASTEGNNGQGFFSFSRSEFASANTDPAYAVLRAEAGSMWTSAYSYLRIGDTSYVLSGWESVYITPFDIAMDTEAGETPAYNGMGLLLVSTDAFGAFIDGQLDGGAAPSLPPITFQQSNFDNISLSQNVDGSYYLSDYSSSSTNFSASGLTTNNDAISFFDGINTGSFTVDSFSESSWSTGYDFLGYDSSSSDVGTIGGTIYSTGWLGETSWNSIGGADINFISDPLNVINGEFYVDETDLTLPGPLSLQIRRNYNSQNQANNLLGYGWKFALMPYINITQSGDLIYAAEPDGSVVAYRKVPSSSPERWEPDAADNPQLNNFNGGNIGGQTNPFSAYLEKTTEGSDVLYQLYRPNGQVAVYRVRSFPITDGADTISRERPYLEQWKDSFGNALNFSYYEDSTQPEYGQLRRIESTNGNFLGFSYNVRAQATEIYTNDGRRVKYAYDGFGDLVKVTLPDNSSIEYEYQTLLDADNDNEPYSTHLITVVRKPDGRVLKNVYDPLYDPDDETYSASKYRRVVQQFSTVGLDLTPVDIAEMEYNPDGDPWVTAGYDVTYVHSDVRASLGRVTTTYVHKDGLYCFIADGQASGFSPTNTAIDHVVAYEWFEGSEPNSFTRSLKTMTDKRGLQTHYEYDTSGSIRKVTVEGDVTGDGVAESVPTYYFFDPTQHTLRKVIYPAQASGLAQRVVYSTYPTITGGADYEEDASNPGTYRYAYLPQKTAEYAVVSPTLDDSEPSLSNKIVETSFQYGQVVEADAEAHGLLLKKASQSNLDTDDKSETTWTYTAKGFPATRTQKTLTTAPDIVTTYDYSPKGELIRQSDPAGRTVRYDYDMMGRLETTTRYASASSDQALSWNARYYNQNGEVNWVDGPRYNPEDYVFRDYDGAGRVIAEVRWRSQAKADGSGVEEVADQDIFSGQSITYYEYDGFGNLVSTIDPRGNETTRDYDSLGQVETITYAVGTDDEAEVAFTYEPGGQVATQTNALEGVTTTLYTDTGKPKTSTSPDDRETAWTYTLDGRVKTQALSNGAVWTYTYDDTALTETRELTNGATLLQKLKLYTDTRGNVVRREEYASASDVYVFETEYDGLNRVVHREGPADMSHPDTSETVSVRQETAISYTYGGTYPYQVETVTGPVKKVEVFDALNRPLKVSLLDAATGTVEDQTAYAYGASHHLVTRTRVFNADSQGTNTLQVDSYTDIAGHTVLTGFADDTYTRQVYDKAGNLTASYDELGLETQFAYDARNRLETTTRPDDSTVTLGYDDAGNVISREMPGDLTWQAHYDDASRIQWEQLTGTGASVSRRVDFAYNTSGPNLGLLQSRIENDGQTDAITHLFVYDEAMRLQETTSAGLHYPSVSLYRQYDWRGLVTAVTRASTSDPDLLPSVRLSRRYDGYRQMYDETLEVGSGTGTGFAALRTHSHLIQSWDGAGRRTLLKAGDDVEAKGTWTPAMDFEYRANGQLSHLSPLTASDSWALDYDYVTNGQLNQSSLNVWTNGGSSSYNAKQETTTATGSANTMRDARGRLTDRLVQTRQGSSTATALDESMERFDDGRIDSYAVQHTDGSGGSWATTSETRNYTYDAENRRLATETYQPDPASPVATKTLRYTFDADDLGVRIKAEDLTDTATLWEVDPASDGLDAFKRLETEERTSQLAPFLAEGTAVGPGKFSLWLGEGASPTSWQYIDTIYPDPDYGSGDWQVPLALADGQYTLKAKAEHLNPGSTFAPESTSTFTVALGGEQRTVTNTYDHSGRLLSRSWASGDVTQTFTWDANGRLVKVVQADNRTTPLLPAFTWSAAYDPLGRRIVTAYVPENSPQAGAEVSRSIYSWFDPQVEFLEIAVETQGQRWWKFYGPDRDAAYGSFQGIGGLEAIVNEASGQLYPVIDDVFGNAVATVDLGDMETPSDDQLVWTEVQTSGYGPLPDYQMQPLEQSGDLLASLAWHSRRLDPTGYFWIGARYYDPVSGSFLSADPLGHSASLDLYSYALGDPINFMDPTGRDVDSILDAIEYGVNNNLVARGTAATLNGIDSLSRWAGLGGIDPNNALYLAAEGAGEGFQGIPNTMGVSAGFAFSKGEGQLTLTGGYGIAGQITLARTEVGGSMTVTDIVPGAGMGFAAEFTPYVSDQSYQSTTFVQNASISVPIANAGLSYTLTTSGNTDGMFSFSGNGQASLSTQPLSPYLSIETGGSLDLTTGEASPYVSPNVGVSAGVSAGAGGFFLVDWDISRGSKTTMGGAVSTDPIGNNPTSK